MIGTDLGPYRIEAELGHGGMARVYKAFHRPLRRYVALKVLDPLLSRNEEFQRRFEQEATIAAQLDHPNIVAVYDLGLAGEYQYIAMRLIEGPTLEQAIARDGRIDADRALGLAAQLADALDYAHQAGVLHRDVKPSNVMLRREDVPVLTDFGIARAAEGIRLTMTQGVVGTPRYMSPEQALAEPLDLRSDLYSLGVVLYEMLAGRPPFAATSTPALLYKHVHESPEPLAHLRPELPAEVQALLDRCLAKSSADRIPNGAALAEACRALRTNPTIAAPNGRRRGAQEASTPLAPAGGGHGRPANLPNGPELSSSGAAGRPLWTGRQSLLWPLAVMLLVGAGLLTWPADTLPEPLRSLRGGQTAPTALATAAPTTRASAMSLAVVPTAPPTATPPPPTTVPTGVPTIAPATPLPEPIRHQLAAERALAEKSWQTAVDETEAGLKGDPGSAILAQAGVQAHLGLAEQLWSQARLGDAQQQYSAVLEPPLANAATAEQLRQATLGVGYLQGALAWDNDLDLALERFQQVYASAPDYRDTRTKLYSGQVIRADQLLQQGDLASAIQHLVAAREIDPDGVEAAARLLALTPTPAPPPPTSRPAPAPAAPRSQPQPEPQPAPQPAPAPTQPKSFVPPTPLPNPN